MLHVLVNINKLNLLPVVSGSLGNSVKLKIIKLAKPSKRGVTHIVVAPLEAPKLPGGRYDLLGTGIKAIKKISQNPELNFWMLYAEGGGVPTFKHGTHAEAINQADFLQQKLGKRVFVLQPVSFVDPVEMTHELMAESESMIEAGVASEDVVVKKKVRERKPIKPQKVDLPKK